MKQRDPRLFVYNERVWENIFAAIQHRNLTVSQVARASGVQRPVFYKRQQLTVGPLYRIAVALRINPSDFLPRVKVAPPPRVAPERTA